MTDWLGSGPIARRSHQAPPPLPPACGEPACKLQGGMRSDIGVYIETEQRTEQCEGFRHSASTRNYRVACTQARSTFNGVEFRFSLDHEAIGVLQAISITVGLHRCAASRRQLLHHA